MTLDALSPEFVETPQSEADIRELVERLNRNEITATEYFAAVERRAKQLVEAESR